MIYIDCRFFCSLTKLLIARKHLVNDVISRTVNDTHFSVPALHTRCQLGIQSALHPLEFQALPTMCHLHSFHSIPGLLPRIPLTNTPHCHISVINDFWTHPKFLSRTMTYLGPIPLNQVIQHQFHRPRYSHHTPDNTVTVFSFLTIPNWWYYIYKLYTHSSRFPIPWQHHSRYISHHIHSPPLPHARCPYFIQPSTDQDTKFLTISPFIPQLATPFLFPLQTLQRRSRILQPVQRCRTRQHHQMRTKHHPTPHSHVCHFYPSNFSHTRSYSHRSHFNRNLDHYFTKSPPSSRSSASYHVLFNLRQ